MFVIWNTQKKAYVAKDGCDAPYTHAIHRARLFASMREALDIANGVEIVTKVTPGAKGSLNMPPLARGVGRRL